MSRYQRGKTSLDFTEARDSEWQWHQLGHMQVCTSPQIDNHASTPLLSFIQTGCPSCHSTNRVKALKAFIHKQNDVRKIENSTASWSDNAAAGTPAQTHRWTDRSKTQRRCYPSYGLPETEQHDRWTKTLQFPVRCDQHNNKNIQSQVNNNNNAHYCQTQQIRAMTTQ